jgi:hypothetical protein
MQNRQRGLSLGGLIVGLFILVVVALFGFRVGPPYMEYFTIKKAIRTIAHDQPTASLRDIRRAFDSRAAVDDFKSVTSADLDVQKEGNEMVIRFAYRKEVPLFGNMGVYLDFRGSSRE